MTSRLAPARRRAKAPTAVRIGRDARQGRGLIGERLRHLLVEHVDRHLDQHRSAAAALQAGESAPQDVRHLGARGHRLGGFGDVAGIEHRVVVRLDVRDAARIAHRQHQQRHGVAIGLRDAAERVLGAGAVLHREHPDLLAAGEPRHGIGHVQPDPLLAHDDRPDADARGELEDMVDRVAEDDLDAFAPQDLRDRLACLHVPAPFRPPAIEPVARALVQGYAGSDKRRDVASVRPYRQPSDGAAPGAVRWTRAYGAGCRPCARCDGRARRRRAAGP